MPGDEQPKLSLQGKIAAIRAEIGAIPKTGKNSYHKYNYAEWTTVQSLINPLLDKHKILILPTVIEKKNTFSEGRVFVEIKVRYTVLDLESDSKIEIDWWGDGSDNGDKGLYKAYSGCGKYFLVKLFGLSTGDDPENDSADSTLVQKDEKTSSTKRKKEVRTTSPKGHTLTCPECGSLCEYHHDSPEYGEVFECVNAKCNKKGTRYNDETQK